VWKIQNCGVCFPIGVEFRRNFEFSTPDPIASGICRTLREDPHDPHCKRSKFLRRAQIPVNANALKTG